MRLDKKLFLYLKEKSSQDEIRYSRSFLEKNKADRKKKTYKRGIDNPIPYSVLPPEINNSIETLPLWYWWEIQRTGNVKLLDTNKSKDKSWKFLFYCAAWWDEMQDQHIKEFGIPKEFHEQSKAKSKLAQAKAKYAVSQDSWDLLEMNIAKIDLEKINPKRQSISNYETKNKITTALNMQYIDPRQIKVIDYYHLMNQATQANKDGSGRN
jgi:hypothetical protein